MKNNRLGIASAAIAAFLYIVHLCHLCLLMIDPAAWFFLFTLPIVYFVGGLGSLSLSIGARFRNEPDLYYAKLGPFLLLTIPVSFVVMAFFEIGLKVNGMKDSGQLSSALTIMILITVGWWTIQYSRRRSAKAMKANTTKAEPYQDEQAM